MIRDHKSYCFPRGQKPQQGSGTMRFAKDANSNSLTINPTLAHLRSARFQAGSTPGEIPGM